MLKLEQPIWFPTCGGTASISVDILNVDNKIGLLSNLETVSDYSGPPLIGTPHLPKILTVIIREVSFGQRESTTCIPSTCCQEFVSFIEGCPF